MAEKTRYTDEELLEFEKIIDEKLTKATKELLFKSNPGNV